LGERLLCKQEVIGSIPFTSTISMKVQSSVSRGARGAEDWVLCPIKRFSFFNNQEEATKMYSEGYSP
jgi:hypothetical protein